MGILVQKYGGSSLASESDIRRVAERIVAAHANDEVVVVVSAMGGTTSLLLDRANGINGDPCHRELDMLLSAGERISSSLVALGIRALGVEAISLTGPQAGIRTDEHHFNASILDVDPTRVREELSRGRVVVVAGYQGLTAGGEVATLGRGGSDTTAVALASALGAARCEICSDVAGVFTADPRVIPEAVRLEEVSHAEMLELSRHGAEVLNPQAVDLASRDGVEIIARSTFSPGGGTRVSASGAGRSRVVGIACQERVVWISLSGSASTDGTGQELLDRFGNPEIFLDHLDRRERQREILLPLSNLANGGALARSAREAGASDVEMRTDHGTVSIVGEGIGAAMDLIETVRSAVWEAPVSAVFTSESSLSLLVPATFVDRAAQSLHRALVEEGAAQPSTAEEIAS